MIKSLSLKNWKSFESGKLWVDSLTVIIGANSAGKSNIVDALSFLSYITTGNRLSDAVVRGGIEGVIRRKESIATISVELMIGTDEFLYEISFTQQGKELMLMAEQLSLSINTGEKYILFSTEPPKEGSDQIGVRLATGITDDYRQVEVRRETSILPLISNFDVMNDIKCMVESVASCLKSIFVLDPKPEKMRDYTPLSEKLASDGSNIAGVIAGLPEAQKKEFEENLTNYVKTLPEKDLIKIWAEPIGRFKTDAMLYCCEEWVDGETSEFDARSMSDGTLRFVAIVAALLSAKRGSTIVIEEIDNGLHPSRAGELVIALKQLGTVKEVDIICTTHNPVLIDALGPEMLPFISYVSRSEESGCSEVHLLEDAPHLLRMLANYTPGEIMTKGFLLNDKK